MDPECQSERTFDKNSEDMFYLRLAVDLSGLQKTLYSRFGGLRKGSICKLLYAPLARVEEAQVVVRNLVPLIRASLLLHAAGRGHSLVRRERFDAHALR